MDLDDNNVGNESDTSEKNNDVDYMTRKNYCRKSQLNMRKQKAVTRELQSNISILSQK